MCFENCPPSEDAHTALQDNIITGPKADAIMACYYAMEAALRTLRPGGKVLCLKFF